jgi:Uma2 family endonuclease
VELPPTSIIASLIASEVSRRIGNFAHASKLGRAVAEGLFHLPLPVDRNRRPDVAYVSFQSWPRERAIHARDNARDVVPELTVEVISPTDLAEDLLVRLDEYFRAGVRLVWVIYPALRTLYVNESATL